MTTRSSIAQLLQTATEKLTPYSDTARLDAEVLLCHCLAEPRVFLYAWPEKCPTDQQLAVFQNLLDRREQGEPLAYLKGSKEFWSHTFAVTKDTLIPRPDTELIVELALSKLSHNGERFLDLGTGAGIIAIVVAKELPAIDVTAVDQSNNALQVAIANAKNLQAKVNFMHSNWFENLNDQTYSVIAANPPYIAADDPHLTRNGLPFEPAEALRSCDNGFSDITAIIKQSPRHLKSSGWLLIEHGHTQGQRTRELMLNNQYSSVETIKDLSDNDRVTIGQQQ